MDTQIDWAGFYDDETREKFQKFHRENPHVYTTLALKTQQLVKAGHRRVGIGMLFEVLRWDYMLQTNDEPFKLNNNYRAYYSRLIEHNNPDWVGIFGKRASKADEAAA